MVSWTKRVRTERAMVRAICRVKLLENFESKSLFDRLGLRNTIEILAKSSGVGWFFLVRRRSEENVLRRHSISN